MIEDNTYLHNMEKELVSILIPVYNRVNFVNEAIESALSQTYKNIEIIISDNCSSDGTWELLQYYHAKYNQIRIFRNSENLGPVKNWKRCIDEATGTYSKILFSDDLIKDTFVENALKLFDKNTAFVLTGIESFGDANQFKFFSKKKSYTSSTFLNDVLLYDTVRFPVSPGCAIFRTNDLQHAILVDIPNEYNLNYAALGGGNDILLFLITATKYPYVKVLNSTESFFRSHPASATILEDTKTLSLYYRYAKYYFIRNYMPRILPEFYTREKIRYLLIKEGPIVGKNLNISFNIPFAFHLILINFIAFLKKSLYNR